MINHQPFFMLLVLLVVTFSIQDTDAYRSCDFIINGQQVHYRHLEMYEKHSAPCDKYRCNDGWEQKISSGCRYEGDCRAVNSTFLATDCNTYRCTMPFGIQAGYWQVTPVRSGCKDYRNVCRQPGEIFPDVLRGVFYNHCECEHKGNQAWKNCISRRPYSL